MSNEMDELTQALSQLKKYMEPSSDFSWRSKIYEPETANSTGGALLKRKLIALALESIACAESDLSGVAVVCRPVFPENLYDQIDKELCDDVEREDFINFTHAIDNLIQCIGPQY